MSTLLDSFRRLLKLDESSNEANSMDRYKILRELNHGAFSKVYAGFDRVTKKEVAVKVMTKANIKEKQRLNILREIAIHKSLCHQNIVQFIEFIDTPENYCLIMELMKGGELFERIEKVEFFMEQDARDIILQAAQAVKYLHENNIVHRDIKPENLVFLNNSLVPVKLCDFGLSKSIEDGTDTPCGTVGYLAPEVLKEQRHSFSVDIWGLGCVLYSLLCGFPVFYDESIPVLTAKVKKGIFDFPSPWWDGISPSAIDLIKQCLIVDPRMRYNIYQFLNHPWMKGDTIVNTRPLTSPAVFKENPMKEVYAVTYAAQRQEIDSFQSDFKPKNFALTDVSGSILMAKREKKKAEHKS